MTEKINEAGLVERIHQEDFAQALGLPSSMKYERDGRDDAKFDAAAIAWIIDVSVNPAEMRQNIIAATLFDLRV